MKSVDTHPSESPEEPVGEGIAHVVSDDLHHLQFLPDDVLSRVSVVANVDKVVEARRDPLVRLARDQGRHGTHQLKLLLAHLAPKQGSRFKHQGGLVVRIFVHVHDVNLLCCVRPRRGQLDL